MGMEVAPIWMVGVSASVNRPLHHKVQKFSSGTGSPEWSRKKGRKMVVVVVVKHEIDGSNDDIREHVNVVNGRQNDVCCY